MIAGFPRDQGVRARKPGPSNLPIAISKVPFRAPDDDTTKANRSKGRDAKPRALRGSRAAECRRSQYLGRHPRGNGGFAPPSRRRLRGKKLSLLYPSRSEPSRARSGDFSRGGGAPADAHHHVESVETDGRAGRPRSRAATRVELRPAGPRPRTRPARSPLPRPGPAPLRGAASGRHRTTADGDDEGDVRHARTSSKWGRNATCLVGTWSRRCRRRRCTRPGFVGTNPGAVPPAAVALGHEGDRDGECLGPEPGTAIPGLRFKPEPGRETRAWSRAPCPRSLGQAVECWRSRSLRRSSSRAWILQTRDSERLISSPISRMGRSSQYLR